MGHMNPNSTHGIALAAAYGIPNDAGRPCKACGGFGLRAVKTAQKVCSCVYRRIFACCLECYFQEESHETGRNYRIAAERTPYGKVRFGNKSAEYCADFLTAARQLLNSREYRVFDQYLLQRKDWLKIAKNEGLDRGSFFHEVHQIQAVLGEAMMERELFPTTQYFAYSEVPNLSFRTADKVLLSAGFQIM